MATVESIGRVLGDILGRSVTAKKSTPSRLIPLQGRIVAVYEGDDISVAAICVCDLSFAAYAGAALVMIPPQAAKECVSSGQCTPDLIENLAEILNICRQCLQEPGRHIGPPRLYTQMREIPPGVAAVVQAPAQRLDIDVTISGYGSGRLSIIG